jgi:hypothetical protein
MPGSTKLMYPTRRLGLLMSGKRNATTTWAALVLEPSFGRLAEKLRDRRLSRCEDMGTDQIGLEFNALMSQPS